MSLLMPRKRIEQTILMIRGLKVMLDHDLAELHGVTAGRLNEAVKKERRLVSGRVYVSADKAGVRKLEIANCDIKFEMGR